MKKTIKFFFLLAVMALVAGVVGYRQLVMANYTISGGKSISEVFEGTISVLGNENIITIKSGSNVEWITLAGNDNRVLIEPGAQVGRIRGLGQGNTIIAPPELELDASQLKGDNNQRRGDASKSLDGF